MLATRRLVVAFLATCGGGIGCERDADLSETAGTGANESSDASAAMWILAEPPALQIGAAEGSRPYSFDRLAAAFAFTDGRIVVADRGTNEIRQFSSHGAYLGATGGRGSGPGEFMALTSVIKLPGDTVVVYDIRSSRITAVAPDLTIASEISRAQLPPVGAGVLLGQLADQRFVFLLRPPAGARRSGYIRDTVSIAIARFGLPELDTLVRVPSTERIVTVAYGPTGPRTVSEVHPFGYTAWAAIWNDQIVVGNAESYELTVYDSVGRLQASLRRDAERERLDGPPLERYLNLLEMEGHSAVAVRELMDRFPGPRFVPAYTDVLVDDLGFLWVGDFVVADRAIKPESRGWSVFGRSGRVVARSTTPAGFEPYHIGERVVVGRFRDDLNVEYVRVYRLQRDSEPSER